MNALALLLASVLPASAESGAAFLKVPVSARSVAVGSALTASADRLEALQWNPAGLASPAGLEIGGTHAVLHGGVKYDFVGVAGSRGGFGWAGGAARLDHGSFEGRGEDRSRTGDFTASDTWAAFGVGFRAGGARFGGSARLLQSSIADASASGVAFDLGFQRATTLRGLSFGLAARNLGGGLRFDRRAEKLPTSWSGGFSWKREGGLTISLDVQHRPNEKSTSASLGLEWALVPSFTVRGGYLADLASALQAPSASTGRLGAGVGVSLRGVLVDYAFTPMADLGAAQRLSFSLRF